MQKLIAAGATVIFLLAGTVQARPVIYTWQGTGDMVGTLAPRAGNKVIGTSRCAAKEMKVDLTVDGAAVTGVFREGHRPQYRFQTTLDATGAFKADVPVTHDKGAASGGPARVGLDDSLIHVHGVIKDGEARIVLEGTCTYKATMTKT